MGAVVFRPCQPGPLVLLFDALHVDPVRAAEGRPRLDALRWNARRGEPGQDLFMAPPGYTLAERK